MTDGNTCPNCAECCTQFATVSSPPYQMQPLPAPRAAVRPPLLSDKGGRRILLFRNNVLPQVCWISLLVNSKKDKYYVLSWILSIWPMNVKTYFECHSNTTSRSLSDICGSAASIKFIYFLKHKHKSHIQYRLTVIDISIKHKKKHSWVTGVRTG